jgi:NAD+ kinase
VKIESVAIVSHEGKPEAVALHSEIASWLERQGIAVTDGPADLVLSLGGDGTMLRAARLAHDQDAFLLGINVGRLGYLTEVDAAGAGDAIQRVLDGSFSLEERMMLAGWAAAGDETAGYVGLNEVLVERSSRHRLVRLQVRVGGEDLATFDADGMIVATPTGSTAYALSAGGPIVSPRASCLVLVPVNAHMIFSRPFVLAPDETVEITVAKESGQGASLVLDGAVGREIPAGCTVTVHRHDRPLRLIRLSGPGFIERLRTKLGLPRQRQKP